MCLRSTLCLWIATAVLVQQSTFLCAQDCKCRCNKKMVCPVIKTLRTDIDSMDVLLLSLKTKVENVENFWTVFQYEVWTEKVAAIENKTKSLEGLKERLDKAESRANSLQRDLEKATNAFDKKIADFENKLNNVQNQATKLDTHVKEAEKNITTTQKKISDFENKLDNVQSQATKLDTNVKEAEKNITTTQKKNAEFEKTLENVKRQAKKLGRNIKKAEESITTTQTDLSNVKARVDLVENQTKSSEPTIAAEKEARKQMQNIIDNIEIRTQFMEKQTNDSKQAIEAEIRVREQLGMNISNLEMRVGFVESQTKEFESTTDIGNRTIKQLEINISNVEMRVEFQEIQTKEFESAIDTAKRSIELLEKTVETLSDTVSTFEMKDKGFQRAISDVEGRLLVVENETENFKPVIKAEKQAREELEEQLLQTVSKKHAETESQFEELKNDIQSQLLLIINETIDLKFDIENEKEFRTEFQKEILLNTSKRFSEFDKEYKELKDDFDTKLLKVENYTKLLKSDIVEERSARNISEEQLLQTVSRKHSEIENQFEAFMNLEKFITKFQSQLMQNISEEFSEAEKQYNILKDDLKADIRKVEDQAKSDVEQEKESRIRSDEHLLQTVSRKHSETESQFEKLENQLQSQLLLIKNETIDLKFDIEKELRTELQVKLQGNFSTSATAQQYLEIKKNLSSFEEKLRTLDQHLSFEKMSIDLVRENVRNISMRMSALEPAFRKVQNDVKELDKKVLKIVNKFPSRIGRGILRSRREMERPLIEVRKYRSTAENKATPLETVIPMEQSVSRIYR